MTKINLEYTDTKKQKEKIKRGRMESLSMSKMQYLGFEAYSTNNNHSDLKVEEGLNISL